MTRTPPTPIVCPRCGGTVGPEQAWCLTCGAPARTRMRPTPNWKIPLAAIAAIVLIVAGGTVGAFVALTTDREAPTATPTTEPAITAPAATPPATQAPTATPTIPPAVGTTPTPGTAGTSPDGTTSAPDGTTTPGTMTTPPPAAEATPTTTGTTTKSGPAT